MYDLKKWSVDEKTIELGYKLEELTQIVDYAQRGTNWDSFIKKTQKAFDGRTTEFYHNLAVIKTAALLSKKFQYEIEYVVETSNGPKCVDLLVKNPRDVWIAVEVKQKITKNKREVKITELALEALDEFSGLGYNLNLSLTSLGATQKNLETKFPQLIESIKRSIASNQLIGSDLDGYFKWQLEKTPDNSHQHSHSFKRPKYPYLKYWSRDKPILEEAYDQIKTTMSSRPNVRIGIIVLDLSHLNFDIQDAETTISRWKSTKPALFSVIILRHHGFQDKERKDFCDDFFTCG